MTDVSTTYYPLGQLSDRVGNTLDFGYSGTAGASSGLPVLTRINDHGSGDVLLTIGRSLTSGPVSSVTDCYGRSVYYQNSWHVSANIAPGFPGGEYGGTQVSQIVATGTGSPAMRYQYGYSLVYNGENSEQVPFLTFSEVLVH